MIYRDFQGEKLSLLGFGTMRLPQKDGAIDQAQVEAMTDYAIANGVNYFDTAYPYHGGKSEPSIGKALSKYPRDSYYLADKYPGHQTADSYDPAEIFEAQLKKCGVEYFDFYLLHNVCENSLGTYLDERWNIIPYFIEQKRLGRIKHLGFSSHGRPDNLARFLDLWGEHMEFCQIQLNWMDWTLQQAKEKYDLLTARSIPVWVMEPVRGGRLANLTDEQAAALKAARPDESIPTWSFRFLQNLPNVGMVLSGMSDLAQMQDNVKIFAAENPLSDEETGMLLTMAEQMKNSLPCTACRYCCDGCPMGLDIPTFIAAYNDLRFAKAGFTVGMMIDSLPEELKPSACLGCGACAAACPQSIDIPQAIADLNDLLSQMPKWDDVCRERAAAAAAEKE